MKKPIPALIPFLVFISLVFIGILIYTYVETRKANPQMIEVGWMTVPGRMYAVPTAVVGTGHAQPALDRSATSTERPVPVA